MSFVRSLKRTTTAIMREILSILSHLVRIHNGRTMFYSYSGEQYACSPRYLSEYIGQHYPDKFEVIWAFRKLEGIQSIPENIKTVRYNSLRFLYYYASSHFIINNIYPYILLKTKKNQIMIDTWHGGGAYKCAVTEKNLKMDPYYRKNLDDYSRNITLFLSSCKAFTDYFIRQDMHYQGEILESGLIRNDMFFLNQETTQNIVKKVKKELGLDSEERILLYAPTWRSDNSGENGYTFDVERLRETLKVRFDGPWRIIFRMHRLSPAELLPGTADASGYPDMQMLLLAADILITDYSSCIWDYALTRRPIFLYTYDLERYMKKQGFYEEIHTWGVPVCETFDELLRAIKETSDEQFVENADAHFDKFVGYDKGQAAQTTVTYMLQHLE